MRIPRSNRLHQTSQYVNRIHLRFLFAATWLFGLPHARQDTRSPRCGEHQQEGHRLDLGHAHAVTKTSFRIPTSHLTASALVDMTPSFASPSAPLSFHTSRARLRSVSSRNLCRIRHKFRRSDGSADAEAAQGRRSSGLETRPSRA